MATPEMNGTWRIIGSIHTPFGAAEDLPIQGTACDAKGTVAVLPEYADGLADLDGFDRVWLLYLVPPAGPVKMKIVPRLDLAEHGLFATRSPLRPNPIGLTCVRLLRVEACTLKVEGVDMLDGVALIDIKPYVPRLDSHEDAWAGWLEDRFPHERAWQDRAKK
jgi:tRNA-Thr(GGU) m(6)t(6)A37 methyltransferase TsaA